MKISDKEFMALWETHKSCEKLSKIIGIAVRSVNKRRRSLETRYGVSLGANDKPAITVRHDAKINLKIENGVVLVFSDAHYFPGIITTAHKGLLHFIGKLKPNLIVCNGDAFDGATISRYPRIGWDKKPSVKQELDAVDERLSEIVKAARALKKGCKLIWPLGNHDSRFETYLAANAGNYEGVHGFHLKDHFPEWLPCWMVEINGHTVIKHRYKGGIHATHNNTVTSGKTIITGHLHSLKVTPWTDYNGTRWGVDTGTLADADPFAEQFVDYLEGNPVNWRSGFAVLTFRNGRLLMPELVQVFDENSVEFRGEVFKV